MSREIKFVKPPINKRFYIEGNEISSPVHNKEKPDYYKKLEIIDKISAYNII